MACDHCPYAAIQMSLSKCHCSYVNRPYVTTLFWCTVKMSVVLMLHVQMTSCPFVTVHMTLSIGHCQLCHWKPYITVHMLRLSIKELSIWLPFDMSLSTCRCPYLTESILYLYDMSLSISTHVHMSTVPISGVTAPYVQRA